MNLTGRWRITEMDLWGPEDIDLVGPGFIELDANRTGTFGFIAVKGTLDWRETRRDGRPGVEFTWVGFDEDDQASGRGWAVLAEDGSLHGHIYFHLGDNSGFVAVPPGSGPKSLPKATARNPRRWR
jgi:hypothetical protein